MGHSSAGRARQPLAVLAIDVDGLRAVASRLTTAVRACDVATRIGGDEFLGLLA